MFSRKSLGATFAFVALAFIIFSANESSTAADSTRSETKRSISKVRFGIYPGGGIGVVGDAPKSVLPESPTLRAESLKDLKGNSRFVAHLYTDYTGKKYTDQSWLRDEINDYTDRRVGVELVIRYRPRGNDYKYVQGYADFVRALIRDYAANRYFVGVQVTNEANLPGQPDASDGEYPFVVPALVKGVRAADSEIRLQRSRAKVGFNWAYDEDRTRRYKFWNKLDRKSGSKFIRAVDWVGINSYPGTWQSIRRVQRNNRVGRTLLSHVKIMRNQLMPRAGLGRRIPIHITENGWPTGPKRSKAKQAKLLWYMTKAVRYRAQKLNISDYRWFDLRDADSSSSSFQNQYGLTDSSYQPKPGFRMYKRIISGNYGSAKKLLRKLG